MRGGRDAIFALIGVIAGVTLSSVGRVHVDVSRGVVSDAGSLVGRGGAAALPLDDATVGTAAASEADVAFAAPSALGAAEFGALPAAGAILPTPPAFAGRPDARASAAPWPAATLWNVSHSLGEGVLWTEQWTRKYRFGPVRLVNATIWPPVFGFEITREFLVPSAPNASASGAASDGARRAAPPMPYSDEGRVAEWAPCGDSLSLRFVGADALFAPLAITERPTACGEFLATFRPPAIGASTDGGGEQRYAVEFRLLHIDGEGLLEPPADVAFYERVGGGGADAQVWHPLPCDVRCQELGPRFYNADLRARGELRVRPPADPAAPLRPAAALCVHGESDGAYVRNADPLWPAFAGEPWVWAPYDCTLRHFPPSLLRHCLGAADARTHAPGAPRALPGVRFMGESTLMDVARAWLLHLREDGSDYHWPATFPTASEPTLTAPAVPDEMRMLMNRVAMRNQRGEHQPVAFREQHGTRVLLDELRQLARTQFSASTAPSFGNDNGWPPPSDQLGAAVATVLSQAHNDGMKETFVESRRALFEALRLLRTYALLHPEARFVWLTGPSRHYKEKHAPGHTECRRGRAANQTSSCLAPIVNTCEPRAAPAGAPPPIGYRCATRRGAPARSFAILVANTRDRVRRFNDYARARARATLGRRVAIVDFEKLTEPLGVEYSDDGVHWSCTRQAVHERRDGADGCHSLANAVAANLVANVVCNPLLESLASEHSLAGGGGGSRAAWA